MPNKRVVKSSNAWFMRVRGSYLPINSNGWLTYIPLIFAGGLVVRLFVMYAVTTGSYIVPFVQMLFVLAVIGATFSWFASTKTK